MFGAFVRGAGAFVLGIILWTPLDVIVTQVLLVIEPQLGSDATVVWALKSIVQEWPLLLLVTISAAVIARAAVESSLGGRPA